MSTPTDDKSPKVDENQNDRETENNNNNASTPQKEMDTVLNRIQELENDFRTSIHQRASRLSQQQEKYSELQSAVESNTRRYKQENQRLRAALQKSEQKQAVLAKRLVQTLQSRNDDETSHLRQLINMHDEQMLTMQEGMRELLKTLGVEDTVIGNLDALCGLTSVVAGGGGKGEGDEEKVSTSNNITSTSSSLTTPAEQILYNIRRQNCELAIALRKSISIVREKLDVERTMRLEARTKASEFLEAATVVDQALQKAAAVILKEERNLQKSAMGSAELASAARTQIDAVSFAPAPIHANMFSHHSQHHQNHHQNQHNFHYTHQQQNTRNLMAPNFDSSFGSDSNFNHNNNYMFGSTTTKKNNNSHINYNYNYNQQPLRAGSGNLNQSPSPSSASSFVSASFATSLAVLKDITFGSLDVIRDMEKIVEDNNNNTDQTSNNNNHHHQQQQQQNLESKYYSPSQRAANELVRQSHIDVVSALTNNSNNNKNNFNTTATTIDDLQISIDRVRSAERAVAGQALLELKREIESHQHTRTSLQKKIAFVTSQYEKLLHSVTSGEDGEYWELSPERQQQQQQQQLTDDGESLEIPS